MSFRQAWPARRQIVEERHFGDRSLRCFADRPAHVPAVLERAIERDRRAIAVVDGERRMSYAELAAEVDAVAAGLISLGVARGDRVALLAGNRPEFLVSVLAILRIGAVAVPVGIRLAPPEVAYILEHSGASVVLHDAGLASLLPPDRARQCVAFDAGRSESAVVYETLRDGSGSVPAIRIGEDDPAVLLYTSGTTGRPKGAVLTHFNIVHTLLHFDECLDLRADDRIALAVPASHVTGLVANLLAAVHAGAACVIAPPFRAASFLDLVARERISVTILVPAMYNLCLLDPRLAQRDLGAWRIGAYGGAPMPEATIAGLGRALPGLALMNAYGATETTSPTTVMPAEATDRRPDSVGRAVPCAELRVVAADGREVMPGEPGELWIKGPMVVPCYWDDPVATERAFVDGWWRSGDVARVDEEGFVTLLDRLKDVINRGGYKIYSVEVEGALAHIPGVIESAVVPRPDPVLGERVHAFVVIEDDGMDSHSLREACAARLADYKVPERFTLMREPLPRNANGKVMKQVLRARSEADARSN